MTYGLPEWGERSPTPAPALRLVPGPAAPLGHGVLAEPEDFDQPMLVRRVQRVTHDVVAVVLQPTRPGALRFLPGQYVVLGVEVEGRRVERCYTISSPPTRPHLLTVTTKLMPGGALSPGLHSAAPGGAGRRPRSVRRVHGGRAPGVAPAAALRRVGDHPDAGDAAHDGRPRRRHGRGGGALRPHPGRPGVPRRAGGDRAEPARRAAALGRGAGRPRLGGAGRADRRGAAAQPWSPTRPHARPTPAGRPPTWPRPGPPCTTLGAEPSRCHEESFVLAETPSLPVAVAPPPRPTRAR